jgi:hypothetical protein
MTTAKDVAQELRELADALDREPDQELPRVNVDFYCKYAGDKGKPMFLALAKLLPRPLDKSDDDMGGLQLKHVTGALLIRTVIEREKVCKIIRPEQTIPAEYECEPLLSLAEESSLTAEV